MMVRTAAIEGLRPAFFTASGLGCGAKCWIDRAFGIFIARFGVRIPAG